MRRLLLTVLLIGPMLLIAFLAIWQRNGMIQLGYETENLQKQRTVLLRHQKDLVAEIAGLSSIERIEQLARQEIQMRIPDPEQRVYISMREKN